MPNWFWQRMDKPKKLQKEPAQRPTSAGFIRVKGAQDYKTKAVLSGSIYLEQYFPLGPVRKITINPQNNRPLLRPARKEVTAEQAFLAKYYKDQLLLQLAESVKRDYEAQQRRRQAAVDKTQHDLSAKRVGFVPATKLSPDDITLWNKICKDTPCTIVEKGHQARIKRHLARSPETGFGEHDWHGEPQHGSARKVRQILGEAPSERYGRVKLKDTDREWLLEEMRRDRQALRSHPVRAGL